jgi:hypothetical protein
MMTSAGPLSIPFDRSFQSVEMGNLGVGTPAIPFEIVRDGLQQFGFRDHTIMILEHREDFRELQFRNHQIFSVSRFTVEEGNSQLSIGQLESAFKCQVIAVTRALKNQLKPPKLRGRHFSLAEDIETQIVA